MTSLSAIEAEKPGGIQSSDPATLQRVREAAAAQETILLRGATVITLDPNLGEMSRGDVLVAGTRILAVSHDLAAHPAATNALTIDVSGTILMPGLVDAHRHCWQGQFSLALADASMTEYVATIHQRWATSYTPDDIALGTSMSLAASINAGVTTVLDFAHNTRSPQHADAAFAAYRDAGIRIIQATGSPRTGRAEHWPEDVLRLAKQRASEGIATPAVWLGLYTPQRDRMREHIEFGRANGLQVAVDAVAGDAGTETVLNLAESKSLGPDVALIHCTGLSREAWAAIARSGTRVILTPTSDALIGLGNGSTPIREVLEYEVVAGLSTDVEASLPGDLFSEMRAALQEQCRTVQAAKVVGRDVPTPATTRTVLELATIGGAAVLGLEQETGSITPGKVADLVVIRPYAYTATSSASPVGATVLTGNPSDVEAVLAQGLPRKWAGSVVGFDIDALNERVAESRARIRSDDD